MKEKDLPTQTRREFLKNTTAIASLAIAPGILLYSLPQAKSIEEGVTSDVRWGILVDTTQCSDGCDDCVKACVSEHGLESHDRPPTDPQWIRKVTVRNRQTNKQFSLPVMCQHCEHPPCRDVCPTGASFKRADGIVLVDRHICIGCRYCMVACPYKARSFVHESLENQKMNTPRGKGTVEACNLCVHRIDSNRPPACVEACERSGHRTLLFGDMKDPNSEIAKKLATIDTSALREELGLNPGVRYQGI